MRIENPLVDKFLGFFWFRLFPFIFSFVTGIFLAYVAFIFIIIMIFWTNGLSGRIYSPYLLFLQLPLLLLLPPGILLLFTKTSLFMYKLILKKFVREIPDINWISKAANIVSAAYVLAVTIVAIPVLWNHVSSLLQK